jgi:hypothetical protein
MEGDYVRKLGLILLAIIIIFYLGVSYHRENEIVSTSFMYYDLTEVDKDIRDWASSNLVSGIYLAKKINNKGLETYYVYVNNMPSDGFNGKNDGSRGLKMEVKINNSVINESKIYEIITTNKNAEYILLNGDRIDTSKILVLSD